MRAHVCACVLSVNSSSCTCTHFLLAPDLNKKLRVGFGTCDIVTRVPSKNRPEGKLFLNGQNKKLLFADDFFLLAFDPNDSLAVCSFWIIIPLVHEKLTLTSARVLAVWPLFSVWESNFLLRLITCFFSIWYPSAFPSCISDSRKFPRRVRLTSVSYVEYCSCGRLDAIHQCDINWF